VEVQDVIFFLLTVVAPIAFGAWTVIFNRRFSLAVIREQKAVWRMDFSRYQTFIRIFSVIAGLVLIIAGLEGGARFLFP
jgi:hypothetical protein